MIHEVNSPKKIECFALHFICKKVSFSTYVLLGLQSTFALRDLSELKIKRKKRKKNLNACRDVQDFN